MTEGPSHYKRGQIEPWDFIRDQDLSYHLGCAVKYIARAGYKESKIQDLSKAIHYLQDELRHTIAASERVSESLSSREQHTKEGYAEMFDR